MGSFSGDASTRARRHASACPHSQQVVIVTVGLGKDSSKKQSRKAMNSLDEFSAEMTGTGLGTAHVTVPARIELSPLLPPHAICLLIVENFARSR